jgi:hypothetical protein
VPFFEVKILDGRDSFLSVQNASGMDIIVDLCLYKAFSAIF